ncbi:MAG: hypothetical protein R3F14_06400 [Polyangiaceae bacterium]
MPRSLLSHLLAVSGLLLAAGCAGNGCTGCGVTPLPQGFSKEARVENAGSLRITQSGMGFLSDNAGALVKSLLGGMGQAGVLTFNIPTTSGSQFGIDYSVCPGGAKPGASPPECVAEIDMGNATFDMATAAPNVIQLTGTAPMRLQDLPIDFVYLFVPDSTDAVINGNGACPGSPQTFADIDVSFDLSIQIDPDPAHVRQGYSRVVVNKVTIDEAQLSAALKFCGGAPGQLGNLIDNILIGALVDALPGQIERALCEPPSDTASPACPDGSSDDNGCCVYVNDGSPVPQLLGMDGHADLGQLLASVSPGTRSGIDFVFAGGGQNGSPPWGNLNPVGGGATLGMYGGTKAAPVSSCVKPANMTPPQGIPIPDELLANTVGGWPAGLAGPDVGLAVSERFFNYALGGMYDSGVLCIGIDADTIGSLSPVAISSGAVETLFLAKGARHLGFYGDPQPVALTIRPGAPPTVVFGNGTDLENDPLIRLGLKSFAIDFYLWSLDRYVRFMTYTADLELPMNLTSTPQGLEPVAEGLQVISATVTNTDLLSSEDSDPATIEKSVTGLFTGILGTQLVGALSNVTIPLNDQLASLGITLTIPETVDGQGSPGMRKLSKGNDNFLGIFGALGLASPPPPPNETNAQVVKKAVDPAGLSIRTATKDNAPIVEIALSSPQEVGLDPVEYQVRLDGGFWRPWSTKRELTLRNGLLRLEGHHTIEVRSRIAGQPMTLDPTPAVLDVLIDVHAPSIQVKPRGDGQAEIVVRDAASKPEAVQVRHRVDGGAWSEWIAASDLALVDVPSGGDLQVEARDEEGLVGTASMAIRGKPAATSGGGCGCTVAGDTSADGKAAAILGALLLGVFLRLGKRRRAKANGRDGGAPEGSRNGRDGGAPEGSRNGRDGGAPEGSRSVGVTRAKKHRTTAHRVRALTALSALATAAMFAGCNCGDTPNDPTGGAGGTGGTGAGGTGTTEPPCPTCDELNPGLAGSYSSVVVVGDTLWVAGYLEKALTKNEDPWFWGDLGVGKFDGTRVQWEAVDGVPEEEVDPEKYDVNGFRGGVTGEGDNVGLWTSIAAKSDGTLGVAYHDVTHGSLKFAQRKEGAAWTITTVEEKAPANFGRYGKLAVVNSAWTIAYLAIEQGAGGAITSSVRVASSSDGASWAFEDVIQNPETPCTAKLCGTGNVCVDDSALCAPKTTGCDPVCTGATCVDIGGTPTCKAIKPASALEAYPEATGLYIAVAPEPTGSLGMVFYDRIKGDLWMASKASGSWVSTLVDGQLGGVDSGDVGIGAGLAIDPSGTWHIVYSNGYDEWVQYVQVQDGVPGTPEIIDDGSGIGGTPFADGRHIVGDDASILVTAGGDIHIAYQDATIGKLHYAVGTPAANGHNWSVKVLDQEGFAGAFSHVIDMNGSIKVTNFSRGFDKSWVGDVNVLTP